MQIKDSILTKTYNPKDTQRWFDFWQEKNYFKAEIKPDKKPYTIMIPPPNVTGSLHMGHALNNTMQDVLIRKKRMEGNSVLWLPGTDHAGIATQNVVEKELHKEGSTRHKLGREKFIERVWAWKEKYGNTIINQLKVLGCSCDFSRERFTMDEDYSLAVKEIFVQLYDEGLIYRDNRIINWCPRCHTALSDIEVEYKELKGHLWYIRYPVKGENTFITVATTRPETMLGDTAVAVNPDDKRFKNLIGKTVTLPLVKREIPIVADKFVDPKFGTGAVKVTPAHDPNDFEIGNRHNLRRINIFSESAKIIKTGIMPELPENLIGMDRIDARNMVVEELETQNLLDHIEDYTHSVGHCYRCNNIIEPYLSLQWFVDMKPLAAPAIEVVRNGKVKFYPKRWEKLYFQWMENIKDWCISRQIWWGHRIPAWYCGEMKNEKCKTKNGIIVAKETPDMCPHCGSTELIQDEDVLDTWFSSAIWPFATLGWPKETDDLKYFYPTSVLVTARDILYFWVARMIMTGLKFMKNIPFHSVVINPTVLNWEGKRMSKSLGTGLDPLDYIEIYGSDALRFGMLYQVTDIQDMKFTEDKLEMSRNFANKIWNASKFVISNSTKVLDSRKDEKLTKSVSVEKLSTIDKWILSKFNELVNAVSKSLDSYKFGEACQKLFTFFWNDFCDWYIELVKNELANGSSERKFAIANNLLSILSSYLRLLHPFMPYITEEIWQSIREEFSEMSDLPESICIAPYPELSGFFSRKDEKIVEILKEIITDIRRLRADLLISPGVNLPMYMMTDDEMTTTLVGEFTEQIKSLAKISDITYGKDIKRPESCGVALSLNYEVYLDIGKVIDINETISKLSKSADKLGKEIDSSKNKLANEKFVKNAPNEIVQKEKGKLQSKEEELKRIANQINSLQA